jgi:hypothetical protein
MQTSAQAEEVIRLPLVIEQVRAPRGQTRVRAWSDPGCWSEAYVLRHCVGFRVEGPGGHLGYVEEVLLDPEGDTPEALLVRGTSTIEVPVSRISRLVPGRELVLVGSKARR